MAFADANFVQAEGTRGSLTDRGKVFVLLGPPTYVGRKPLRAGEDPNEAEGMSLSGSEAASNAMKIARGDGKGTPGRKMAAADKFSGPGERAADSGTNWRETWHYRKEMLPKGVRYQQVDIEFVTKSGYGVNVLQPATQTVATLEAARGEPRQN